MLIFARRKRLWIPCYTSWLTTTIPNMTGISTASGTPCEGSTRHFVRAGMLIKSRSRVSRSSGVDLNTEDCRSHRLFRFEAAGLGRLHRLAPRSLRMCEITYLLSRRQVPLLEDVRTSLIEHSKLWPAFTLNTFSHPWRKLEDSTLHLFHPTLAPTCMHRTQLFQTAAEHPHHDTIFRCVVRQFSVLA